MSHFNFMRSLLEPSPVDEMLDNMRNDRMDFRSPLISAMRRMQNRVQIPITSLNNDLDFDELDNDSTELRVEDVTEKEMEEENEIKRAMDASLNEERKKKMKTEPTKPVTRKPDYIVVSDDEEDPMEEELKEVLRLSRLEATKKSSKKDSPTPIVNIVDEDEPQLIYNRKLRREQDKAFEESLIVDTEKERMRMELEKQKEEEEAIRMSIDLNKNIKMEKLRSKLSDEPRKDNTDSTVIVVRMPDGKRLERIFLGSDKIELLRNFIELKNLEAGYENDFEIVSDFPKMIYSNMNITLKDAGLFPRSLVSIIPK